MSELLEVYKSDGTFIGTQERKDFYLESKREFETTGEVSKKVKTIRVFLMTSAGRIYLQKRSLLKDENSGLYDKTVGGHVSAGDTSELTVVKECAEELGFPVSVLSKEDFKQAVKSIDLKIIGVLSRVDHIPNFKSIRVLKNGKQFEQVYITDIYVGYFDGAIRFADGESSGVETFSIGELTRDIKDNPGKFTEDVKFMVEKYHDLLVPVVS
jgi:isopentenyldiphosphate isomerase